MAAAPPSAQAPLVAAPGGITNRSASSAYHCSKWNAMTSKSAAPLGINRERSTLPLAVTSRDCELLAMHMHDTG